MDPDACLRWIEEALHDGQRRTARELRRRLYAWLARGGFAPSEATRTACPQAAHFVFAGED